MALKRYQERVVREVGAFLEALAREQAGDTGRYASAEAWRRVVGPGRKYVARENALHEDVPNFCIKVPTGGGKTLLATQILGRIHETVLRDRNGAGLVLWIVPSDQILRDTLRTLRDRRHFHRQSLEFALASRRVEVWEKHEIARLTPTQLASQLNILVIQLASTNRASREQLKFFRDSGGNIVLHFPPEDRPELHARLKERVPNLEMLGDELVKTSLANLVRLSRPAVIIDEGHKATSTLARRTIEEMNPSIEVELSATPPEEANVVVSVSGRELLDEEMIKLPVNVSNSNVSSWQECLARADEKRRELKREAEALHAREGRTIRPIVLVQVERTGKDQRDGTHVHSDDVRDHLTERLGVTPSAIAAKTSAADEIEGVDLLDDGCPIEWIITKAALQEGWDCPFAYVLVSLNAGKSTVAMTQLVGRILRQPHQRRTATALDESYVFCLKRSAAEVVKQVKATLEKEGYEGDLASVVDKSSGERAAPEHVKMKIRREHLKHYLRPFEGRIFLPKFCVRIERSDHYEPLDYFRHLIARVDIGSFDYRRAAEWSDLSREMERAGTSFFRVHLGRDAENSGTEPAMPLDSDERVIEWIAVNLPFEHWSLKDLSTCVRRTSGELLAAHPGLRGRLALVKHALREKVRGFIEAETDLKTEDVFRRMHKRGEVCFYLQCVECRFEIPRLIERRPLKKLLDERNEPLQRSLFEWVPEDDLNPYERDVALYLDRQPQVLWWYRNLVGPENFSIQGFRRDRIYPDFVVQEGRKKKPIASVLVIESKGAHLKGNPDTTYKRDVAELFTICGKRVPWQKLAGGFADRRFRFQVIDEGEYSGDAWRHELQKVLDEAG